MMCECVSVFACHQLTDSLVEEGNYFIQLGIMVKVGGERGRTVFFFICELEYFLSKGTLSFTVRRYSSVEEPRSWLDSNGKHKVRLVTKQRMDCCLFVLPEVFDALFGKSSFV